MEITMRTALIFIPLMLSSFYSNAEPKKLICQTSAKEEQQRLEKFINEPDASESSKKFFTGIIKSCEGASFGLKKVFTFDTDGFESEEKSKVEVAEWISCDESKVKKTSGKVETTPSLITFKYTNDPKNYFNIERKTLRAGRHTLRDFNCKIEDIDTSKNLL